MSTNSTQTRVAYIVSHPIQYQAPLLRYLARQDGLLLKVFFESDFSVRGYRDPDFGVDVRWDIPLLEGYDYAWLKVWRRAENSLSFTSPVARDLRATLFGYDVLWVHGYARLTNLLAIVVASQLGLKILMRGESTLFSHERGGWKKATKQFLLPKLFSKMDGFLTIGRANAAYYRHYGVPEKKLFRMSYAVDNTFFQTRASAANVAALRAELKVPEGRSVVLYSAKFQMRKRPLDLLQAFVLLRGRLLDDQLPYLFMVGDGELRADAETFVREHRLSNVFFLGFRNQSELPGLYALCDVFVLPSEHEPWGLAINEVMNAAKPVITTHEVGAAEDLIEEGVTGYVYPVGDTEALAECLMKVLASSEHAQNLGRAALKRVSQYDFAENWRGLKAALIAVAH